MEKLEASYIANGNVKWLATVENSFFSVPLKVKHWITIWLSSFALRYVPKELKKGIQINVYTGMFIAALLSIASNRTSQNVQQQTNR